MQTSAVTNMYTFLLVQLVWKEKLPAIVGCVYLHMSRNKNVLNDFSGAESEKSRALIGFHDMDSSFGQFTTALQF